MNLKLPASILLLVLACALVFYSCKKDLNSNNSNSMPLASFILADTSITLFTEIIQRGNDIGLLASIDSITILAPTNAAFRNAGITKPVIDTWSYAKLDSITRYEFIPSPISLVAGSYSSFNSLLQFPVYGYTVINDSVNYFNGSAGVKQSIPGSKATLYKLNAPLQLPVDSLNHLLSADSTLSFFAEALARTGITVIPATGWNTLLVPDNNAFINAGYPDTTSIDSADVSTLSNILQYHILTGQYFSNYFIDQTAINASQGGSISITFNNGILQFTGTGNSGPASVTLTNKIAGANIIVYKINKLLLP
jgi:uncharacterized surface protein with fasciclin (FAS1) repeats